MEIIENNDNVQQDSDIHDFFNNSESPNDIDIPWRHCFYKIYYNIRRLFYSSLKSVRRKEDLNLINQVSILLQTEQSTDKETINKCAQLIAYGKYIS